MIVEIHCPECDALLRVSEELAGKQAKCPQCDMQILIPMSSPQSAGGAPNALSQVSPDDMVHELSRRGRSVVLALFDTPESGEYNPQTMASAKVRVYSSSDMDDTKKLQALSGLGRIAAGIDQARGEVAASQTTVPLFEFKGDSLGMTLSDFKKKHARKTGGIGMVLPWCSSDSPGQLVEALLAEPWHSKAGIVHARVDLPAEKNSPTVAGVKTDLVLYQFLNERLFRITALFETDSFHVIRKAVADKHGEPTNESIDPMWFSWEEGVSSIHLVRGKVRPKKASELHYVHNPLFQQVEQLTPKSSDDL